jgi:hypothetical protein
MRLGSQPGARTGSELERRYPVALALYLALGVLIWFTVGEGAVVVYGKPVEIRVVALLIVGSFALRTFVARHADRIRHGGDEGGDSAPKGL